ncbi:MAG TPA: DUF4864 domain-containing protein [Dongiaceae bacterium]|jgi:hypothetical protein|nr:DUF4864 domain-containing protein [Dongiaceae bacterium]
MIRRVLAVLILALGVCGPAAAQSVAPDDPASTLPAPDQAAIRHVIEAQLAAFQRDDGVEAFGYATPAIQQKFGDATNFMAMVKGGYPAVYRPRSVTFDKLVDTEFGPDQILRVIGPDGAAYTAHYIMQKQPDGTWMINGCYLTRGEDRSV